MRKGSFKRGAEIPAASIGLSGLTASPPRAARDQPAGVFSPGADVRAGSVKRVASRSGGRRGFVDQSARLAVVSIMVIL